MYHGLVAGDGLVVGNGAVLSFGGLLVQGTKVGLQGAPLSPAFLAELAQLVHVSLGCLCLKGITELHKVQVDMVPVGAAVAASAFPGL